MKPELKVKREASDQSASLAARILCLPLMLALVMLVSIAEAQTARSLEAEDPEQPPEDSSQQVDESDESYRQRMELRDGLPNQQTRIETTYSSPASNAKIDQLPVPSQKHIKDQLREMIITEGQWEPGEDLSDYPYEPSAGAQADSQLRGKEREAWSEELEKYQEREAAAYAQATGQSPTESAEQGQAGQQGQPGAENGAENGEKGQQGSSGSGANQDSATAAAERKARAEQAAAAYQGESRSTEEAVSTAGVSESALSYVQSMIGGSASAPPGGSAQQPGGQEGEQRASGQQSAQEGGQDAAQDAAQQAAQMAAAESKTGSGEATEDSEEQEAETENLAGTIAVGDLQNLFAESGQSPATPANEQGITSQTTQTLVAIEPGTLTIEELRKLDGNNP